MTKQKTQEREKQPKTGVSPEKTKNSPPREIGGYENKPDPTRHGDWNTNGRVSDF